MTATDPKKAQGDLAATLAGEPVDPRRPIGMSRSDYHAKPPGRHTQGVFVDAGLLARRKIVFAALAMAVAGALAFALVYFMGQ